MLKPQEKLTLIDENDVQCFNEHEERDDSILGRMSVDIGYQIYVPVTITIKINQSSTIFYARRQWKLKICSSSTPLE